MAGPDQRLAVARQDRRDGRRASLRADALQPLQGGPDGVRQGSSAPVERVEQEREQPFRVAAALHGLVGRVSQSLAEEPRWTLLPPGDELCRKATRPRANGCTQASW